MYICGQKGHFLVLVLKLPHSPPVADPGDEVKNKIDFMFLAPNQMTLCIRYRSQSFRFAQRRKQYFSFGEIP